MDERLIDPLLLFAQSGQYCEQDTSVCLSWLQDQYLQHHLALSKALRMQNAGHAVRKPNEMWHTSQA
ncbi:hypothetical protein J1614_011072 [Plenodomus biglobosus]|nr:hypothetical protein J1614_011072 [Plenodomus biglobosus]